MKKPPRFPLRLLLSIRGQQAGSITVKSLRDYKHLRRRGFTRPIEGITYFKK